MTSSEITRKARSNLAFALHVLPRERRDGMVVFYAYCRVIDDIADDESRPAEERKKMLDEWRHGVLHGFAKPTQFQTEVEELIVQFKISRELMADIIEGCAMDTVPQRFATWEDLQRYTWKVACAVGLVSLKVFGAENPASETYAVNLGHALQLTNIMRDVNEDLDNECRIYLPLQDLEKFHYSESDLIARVYDERFIAMMSFQAERAEALYQAAIDTLPSSDQKALAAAEVMRKIYHSVLMKMKADRFRVFEKRYALTKWQKLGILLKQMM